MDESTMENRDTNLLSDQQNDLIDLFPPEPINIFFSYAHEDKPFCESLSRHLASWTRMGVFTQWYDDNIRAGKDWAEEIYKHLNAADIILLLVSPAFMNSDRCYHVEMTQALKLYQTGSARVIPVILRRTYWEHTPIGVLKGTPRNGRPINAWRNRDDAFFYVVGDIFEETKLLVSQRWVEKSKVFHSSQRDEYALTACERAIALNPRNITAYFSKCAFLWNLKQYEEALNTYNKIILLEPKNILARMSISYALMFLGRYDEALVACSELILLDPENAIGYLIKAHLHELLRDHTYQKIKMIDQRKLQALLKDGHPPIMEMLYMLVKKGYDD